MTKFLSNREVKTMDEKPTYKQIKFLMAIEERLDIRCEGKTRKEVSEFISKHIEEFKAKDEYQYWNED
jgi:hypothetical protein